MHTFVIDAIISQGAKDVTNNNSNSNCYAQGWRAEKLSLPKVEIKLSGNEFIVSNILRKNWAVLLRACGIILKLLLVLNSFHHALESLFLELNLSLSLFWT